MKALTFNRKILCEIAPKGQDWHLTMMELKRPESRDFQ